MAPYDWLALLQWPGDTPRPDDMFWAALLLVAGALAGEAIARSTRLPRVIGYTLAGCAAVLIGLGSATPLQGPRRLIVDIALALLLFEIGVRVPLRWLAFNPALLLTSLAEAALGGWAVFAGLRWLGIDARVAMACAVLALPASAAMSGRVALELRTQGQVTDRATLLTALDTLYAVIALTLVKGWWQADGGDRALDALSQLAWELSASLLLAALLALVIAGVARRLDLRNESAALLLLGLVVLAIATARTAGLSTLLVPLLAGMVLRNSTDRPWVWPRHFGTAGGVLVLLLFCVVGASWTPAVLAAGGAAALLLVGARVLGKGVAVVGLARWSGTSWRQGLALALTMTPLSAAALVMLGELQQTAPRLGAIVAPIVLTAIAVLEIIGPIAVYGALRLARELPVSETT